MRTLLGMVVVAPGDPVEVEHATRAMIRHPGPCYLRLGRVGEPTIHRADVSFQLGEAILVHQGCDLTLISTGGLLSVCVQVAEQLAKSGIEARVLSMHTLKPLDTDAVLAAARETGAIVTVEEHSIIGGLGSAVAEVLAEAGEVRVPFKRLGLPPDFSSPVGDQEYLQAASGLNVDGILKSLDRILALVSR